jgi:hypothetical protein
LSIARIGPIMNAGPNGPKEGDKEMQEDRALSRSETHDMSVIIGARAKVLKAHVDEQATACLADFEKKLAARYSFDQDEVWKAAAEAAQKVVTEAQEKIAERCEKLGIPKTFAPSLELEWYSRGENASRERRAELRVVAKAAITAMSKAAITKIEKQSLELRTQVVALGLLSPAAKAFLESLAPVDETMRALDFGEIEQKLTDLRVEQRRLSRY